MLNRKSWTYKIGLSIGFIIFIFISAVFLVSSPSRLPSKSSEPDLRTAEFISPHKELVQNANELKLMMEDSL